MPHKKVGVTIKHFGNGEIRIVVTDDRVMIRAMRVKKQSGVIGITDYMDDRDGCITGLISGVEVKVNGQKTYLHFGEAKV